MPPLPEPTWLNPAAPPPARAVRRGAWLAVIGLVACLGLAVYLATWWHSTPPVSAHVFAADYSNTVIVPHNGTAGAWPAGFAALNPVRLPNHLLALPAEPLTRGTAWLDALATSREPNVVVVLAAHGGCDEAGAFLLPDDITPDPAHRIRLTAVVDALAKLPARVPKLLLLDAAIPAAVPNLGILRNDFARGLDALDARITDVPNLLVFNSAAPDQRSWVNEERGRTAFCDAVLNGLAGRADRNGDGRVYGDELAAFVSNTVTEWAWTHRRAVQTPVLYPRGDEGTRRARNHFLTRAERRPDPSPPSPFAPSSEWVAAQAEFRRHDATDPHPIQFAPTAWAEYRAWISRVERLERIGATDAARDAHRRAAELSRRLDAARALPVVPQTLSLTRAAGAGLPAVDADKFRDWLDRFARTPDAERGPLRAELAGFSTAPPARIRQLELLLDWTAADPLPRMPVAAPLAKELEDGLPVRPAEVQFLLNLARQRSANSLGTEAGLVFRRVVRLRLRAEAAWSHPTAAVVRAWLEPPMARADAARRLAEDHAIGGEADALATANRFAEAAERELAEVERLLSALAFAERARHVGAEALARHAEWVADATPPATAAGRQEREDRLRELLAIQGEIDALADRLREPPSPELFARIEAQAPKVTTGMDSLQVRARAAIDALLDGRAAQLPPPELATWWRAADAALALHDPHRRADLLTEAHRAARQLIALAPPASAAPDGFADGQRADADEAARIRGRTLLARLGPSSFAATAGEAEYARTAFELDQFARLDNPFAVLTRASGTLSRVQRELPALALTQSADRATREPADRVARRLPLLADPKPADAFRLQIAGDLLAWHAVRTRADYYADGDTAYHRTAVERLAASARQLTGTPFPVEPTPEVPPVDVTNPATVTLTDQPEPRIAFAVQPGGSGAGAGVVVFRSGTLEAVRPTHGERAAVLVPVPNRTGELPAFPIAEESSVALTGAFRGRAFTATSAVSRHPVPHVVAVDRPANTGAAVAVRVDPAVQAKRGIAGGQVHFVLDATGSMRPDPDKPDGKNRFAEACDALEAVLAELPQGVTVTVSVFGHKRGPDEEPEAAFETVLPARKWDGKPAVVMPLVRAVNPWHKSAVVRAVLRAKATLAADGEQPQAVVLISDCQDNRWATDSRNAKKQTAADTLRAAFDGVPLHVLAVPVAAAEQEIQSQFKVVTESRPAGLFLPLSESAALARWLRTATGPRVRVSVEPPNKLPPRELLAATGDPDAWAARLLPAGESRLRAFDLPPAALVLRDGDRLLLRFRDDPQRPWERVPFAQDAPALARKQSAGWVAAIPHQRITPAEAWEAVLLLDETGAGTEPFAPARLADVWIEADATDSPKAVALRWARDGGWPSPAWNLTAKRWPTALDGGALPPAVRAWWQPAKRFVATRVEAVAKTHATPAGEIVVESIAREKHAVEILPGKVEERECVAVRYRFPPGKPHLVRAVGFDPDGSEQRLYSAANAGTALFWSNGSADPLAALRGLDFVDLSAAKADAKAVELPPLPVPVRRPAVVTPAPN